MKRPQIAVCVLLLCCLAGLCHGKMLCCHVCGDPHYRTFDHKWIHFQGTCKYDVASHVKDTFRVHGKNVKLGFTDVSYLKYFDVYYGATATTVRLGPGTNAYDCTSGCVPITPGTTVGGISVQLSGGQLWAKLPNLVYVTYQSSYCGEVCVPAFQDNVKLMKGICGDMDGNTANDLTTKYGFLVPDNFYGHQVLGNSWQVEDKEDPKCCSKIGDEPCQRRHKICDLILKLFEPCAKVADPKGALIACQTDVCNASPRDGKGQLIAACRSIYNMKHICRSSGILIPDTTWAELCDGWV